MRRFPALAPSLAVFFLCFLVTGFSVHAQTISPPAYTIEGGRAVWERLDPNTPAYTLVETMGEANAGLFVRNGYVMQSGHRNRAQSSKFTVSLNAPSLDYGAINRNQSITKDINILVSFPDLPGYTLSVAQDHPLTSPSGKTIPDVICDSPRQACHTRQAARWTDLTVPGFGYRIDGHNRSTDFLPPTHYRPFTSLGLVDRRAATIVQSETGTSPVEQTVLTVKVQSLPSDISDQYTNTIIITAVPTL